MQKISRINALLNIREIVKGTPLAYNILSSSSEKEAKKLSKDLISFNLIKKREIEKIKEEIEENIINKERDSIIFEGSKDWDVSLMGTVAGSLVQKYQKPVFLYKKIKKENLGSIRSFSNLMPSLCEQQAILSAENP